jgi:peptide subunit release factor 1 (eRF1)
MPAPPPPGELRKVKLTYVCPQCGMQLRVTQAPDQEILAPRHCMDEMDLVPEPD